MNITVVGTGYVGLVTGTCLAEAGNDVVCVDVDAQKVAEMQAGKVPIYEPGLEDVFKRNIDANRLSFTTDLAEGVKSAEVIFLALPTPPKDDGSADLSYVLDVSEKLAGLLDHYAVVVNKSTVPIGTAQKVKDILAKNPKVEADVVSNPEFLREGFAVDDFMRPDRVIIGSSSDKAKKIMGELYQSFVDKDEQIIFMGESSAEMTKYAANSFLATKITFMNEIANLSELVGADVDAVRLGIGADERIGKRFLFAGIGYGGSCFPKDVSALYQIANDAGYDFQTIKAVTNVNNAQKLVLVDKLKKYFGDLSGKKFALWGLAFKPDTDDIREAPALEIIKALTALGASVVAYDPEAVDNVKKFYPDLKVTYADDMYQALDSADALLVATEWKEFRGADISKVKSLLNEPIVFDGRNIFDPAAMQTQGFYYESIGRPTIKGRQDV